MADIDALLDDYKDDGVSHSSGVFTVDFHKAREKLAKFQLRDPHELILKFVQAGNVASSGVAIAAARGQLTIRFQDWNSELGLQQLAEKLASASLNTGDDPISHLCVGLSALMGLSPEPIQMRQKFPGSQSLEVLEVGQGLDWKTEENYPEDAHFLEVSCAFPPGLNAPDLKAIAIERCGFAPVPITFNGEKLPAGLPDTLGSFRPQFFRENRVLARHQHQPRPADVPPPLPSKSLGEKVVDSQRAAELRLTVDLDPKATIWLCKAGVLAEKKKLDLGVPGIVGMVDADDLPTDLTGSQFLQGDKLDQVTQWLKTGAQTLLADGLLTARGIVSEAQPPSTTAPIKTRHGCMGCSFALFGWLGCCIYIESAADYVLTNLAFWLLFPLIWVGVVMYRHGCEKDDNSDKAAKQHLVDVLSRAQRR